MPHPEADARAAPSHPYPGEVPFRPPGLHGADGLTGPPRRYLAAVALLAGAASLPLIAAVLAGPGARGPAALGDVSPFLAPPSGGPVVVPLPPAPGPGDRPAVAPGGGPLPVVRLPAVLGAGVSSAAAPGWLTTGTQPIGTRPTVTRPIGTGPIGAANPDPATSGMPAPGAKPVREPGSSAASPSRKPNRAAKSKADRAARGGSHPARGAKARGVGPEADRDDAVGTGSAQGPGRRPQGRGIAAGRR